MSASKSRNVCAGGSDDLRATLAHELRNPLAALANASAILERTPEGEAAAWARRIIARQVTALARVLDEVLDPPDAGIRPAPQRAVRYTAGTAPRTERRIDGANMGTVTARRVLIVDDNQDSASSTAFLIEAMGHETRMAADGLAAVTCAEGFRPDVIFMDLGLPRIDGREAATRIRAEPWGKRIRIVALSGWAPSAAGAEPTPFDEHLVKPVRPADLAAAIAAIPD